MSEEKKSRRGGHREGAGRKPKGYVSPSALCELDVKAAEGAATPKEVESLARVHARIALESLKKVMLKSESDASRVRAANVILERGFGKPSTEAGVDMILPLFSTAIAEPSEIMDEARKLAPLAIAVLDRIAQASTSAAARVAACDSLLSRGIGTANSARPEQTEKKDRRDHKAEMVIAALKGTEWERLLPPKPPKALQ